MQRTLPDELPQAAAPSPCTLGAWKALSTQHQPQGPGCAGPAEGFSSASRGIAAAKEGGWSPPPPLPTADKPDLQAGEGGPGFLAHYLSSRFSASRQLRPQPGMNTDWRIPPSIPQAQAQELSKQSGRGEGPGSGGDATGEAGKGPGRTAAPCPWD